MPSEHEELREHEFEVPASDELLWRQVHPKHIDGDQISKLAFLPSPKDEGELSVNRASIVTAQEAFEYYTVNLGYESVGVQAVSAQEVTSQSLRVIDDSNTEQTQSPGHAFVDYRAVETKNKRARIASQLRDHAIARGWQFRPQI